MYLAHWLLYFHISGLAVAVAQSDDVDGDITVALACMCGEASGIPICIALNAAETKHMCAWMHVLGACVHGALSMVHGA